MTAAKGRPAAVKKKRPPEAWKHVTSAVVLNWEQVISVKTLSGSQAVRLIPKYVGLLPKLLV